MVDRPKKPSALDTQPGQAAPQPQVNVTDEKVAAVLPTGESVEILLYGATIISWKDAQGEEKLFLSEKAKLDGTKAVRGGVPLVFPVFGTAPDHPAVSKLPQHGFARISRWEFLGKSSSESSSINAGGDSSVKLDFGLSSNNLSAESKAAWPHEFGLIYSVTLSRGELATSIVISNEDKESWEFQTLLHTYFRVKDISNVTVTGLESSSYLDKLITPLKPTTSPASPLSITAKTDRVYTPAGGDKAPVEILEGGKPTYTVVRDNLNEVVVWNPWENVANEMGDFGPADGWKNMICVEAGAVSGWQKLEPGETFEGGQFIRLN
ncbi:putative glucose-6-phosphate 1-epimerase [Xylogone sp. PMI_703]|nr:putative glucose-6-phosphate 1-epimerase [Xylogone sp. PMI_703]